MDAWRRLADHTGTSVLIDASDENSQVILRYGLIGMMLEARFWSRCFGDVR
jgi:hypothetical protein